MREGGAGGELVHEVRRVMAQAALRGGVEHGASGRGEQGTGAGALGKEMAGFIKLRAKVPDGGIVRGHGAAESRQMPPEPEDDEQGGGEERHPGVFAQHVPEADFAAADEEDRIRRLQGDEGAERGGVVLVRDLQIAERRGAGQQRDAPDAVREARDDRLVALAGEHVGVAVMEIERDAVGAVERP